jgi:oligopeptide transport system ATP-binding protein
MAIIWITHDLGVIAGIADRVMVMYGGQIVEQAPVKRTLRNPQHPYTRALLQTDPAASPASRARHRLKVIEGQPPILTAARPPARSAPAATMRFDRCDRETRRRAVDGRCRPGP